MTVCLTEPCPQGAQSLGGWVGSPRAAAVGDGQIQRGGYKVKAQESSLEPFSWWSGWGEWSLTASPWKRPSTGHSWGSTQPPTL